MYLKIHYYVYICTIHHIVVHNTLQCHIHGLLQSTYTCFSCPVFLTYVSLSNNRYFVPVQHVTHCLHITSVIIVPLHYITYGLHITTLLLLNTSTIYTPDNTYLHNTSVTGIPVSTYTVPPLRRPRHNHDT